MISNSITIFRIGLIFPFLAILLLAGRSWLALGLFLIVGGLDVVDGYAARALGESSRFGAMLDLIGDRLLTFAALTGILVIGDLGLPGVLALIILGARDLVYVSITEAANKEISRSSLETPKIALAFLGLSLAMAPHDIPNLPPVHHDLIATTALIGAAALSVISLIAYARQVRF